MNARNGRNLGQRQQGAIMVLFVVGLTAMLGMVGLALDGSHGMLSKTRLQNVVDAAALSAAKTLDISDDEALAGAEALDMFSDNAGESGHTEIANYYASGDITVSVEFSSTLDPFVPGSTPADYVRVTATGLDLPGWFITVMGRNELRVAASAVAGPSPTLGEACNIAPMMVCGDDSDPSDKFFGYTPGTVDVLKTSSGGGGDFEVGPGNFQLVRLDGNTGAADLRTALAGGYDACVDPSGDVIPTEPGNTIGPVAQGLNTRLGIYQGPLGGSRDIYPPDTILDQVTPMTYEDGVIYYDGTPNPGPDDLPFGYEEYVSSALTGNGFNFFEADGTPFRRVLRLPVGKCDGTTNGAGDVPLLGVLCFFMLQEVVQKGNNAEVYGQFMGADGTCPVTGKPGPLPVTGPGPYTIQLYKDADRTSA